MHPIFFLWSHPRSVSSAFERVMHERGDLHTLHEPFLYHYYLGQGRRRLPLFEPDPDHPRDYAAIRDSILAVAAERPVFVKDMCYYVVEQLAVDSGFLRRITSSFLIRDPRRAIASYLALDPGASAEETGYEAQWRVFEQVLALRGAVPLVLDADDLVRNPKAAVRTYCDALGLPFLEAALHWRAALPESWRFVAGWHGSLARSTGLGVGRQEPPPPDLDSHPRLRELVESQAPWYRRLRAFRVSVR